MRISFAMRMLGMALACALLAISPLSAARAADPVILTVSGIHAESGEAVVRDLSLRDIVALDSDILRTSTVWTDGEIEFKGIRIEKLFALLDIALPELARCTALNEYQIELPMSDARETTVLMAYAKDGAYMRVRDKGPLWIVYPRGSGILDAANKMIWQLRKIEAVY